MAATRADRTARLSARDLIGSTVSSSVERLIGELPRARAGQEPEGVHQARVATRRLRSDLRTFAPLLDETWRVQMRAELRRLTDALGAVRDADVLTAQLDEVLGASDLAPNTAMNDLLVAQRSDARDKLVAAIDDPRTDQLIDRLREAGAAPPTTPKADGPATRRLRPLAARPWEQVRRAVRSLPDDPSSAELHRVRLLAKRARYAAEAVTPVYGRDAKRFGAALARLQDVLGDMNDAEQLANWLTAAAPHLTPADAFVAGRLVAGQDALIEGSRHQWQASYARAEQRSAWLTS